MNLSMKWLNDYVKADMSIKDFAHGMTMSGSKVEKYTDFAAPLSGIVCGKIVNIEKHQDSDKLWVAQVDVGSGENVQIVTGAQNITQGAFVPVVLEGGTVYNRSADGAPMNIKRGKLRGIESCGMMCSPDELGLSCDDLPYADMDGILILDDDPEAAKLEAGMDALEFLGLRDTCVEFEITNNRPDCLSVIGLAREAGAAFNKPVTVKKPEFKGVDADMNLKVSVLNKNLCSRYMAAVIRNVKIAPSPRWLTSRLRASGVRAINNIVDITNYVMLEYGHPMHAFDKRYVDGDEIIVRSAAEGEKIILLDGEERVLSAQTLVIADAKKPVAIAGVMGGEFSGVTDGTSEIVFESACFDGVSVRKTAQMIGRRTESSSRFEKGIDPANAEAALLRACELIEAFGCGEVVKTMIDIDFSDKTPVRIPFNPGKINTILGSGISETEQADILERLGFVIEDGCVIVPSIRRDINLECDLAEEIARIYGYNEIASTLPKASAPCEEVHEESFRRKTAIIMQGLGCFETMTFSFISPAAYEKARISDITSVALRNPLGEDTSVMRASMLPSVLEVIARNCNNRNSGGRFYEIGTVFKPADRLPDEQKVLCIGAYGDNESFAAFKGIIEELLWQLGIEARFCALTTNKSYHMGRCAMISSVGQAGAIGVLGEVHPIVLDNFDIGVRAYCAEIDFNQLLKYRRTHIKYRQLPKYPAMTRDLSLVCDETATCGKILDIIKASGKNLESAECFDVYMGAGIPEGKKSLSYRLVFRKAGSTLTDEETDKAITRILNTLVQNDVVLR